ncbi:MAG: GH92 family glycosyl hydrolase, partial [Gluconacetobacter diazotrophicus]|nr:GH92 family glycosyl hydrolase [Gluconacetobacter diazotrophicus]
MAGGAVLLGGAAAASSPTQPAELVDPLIGTANGGNVFPGAVVPFGMAQLSPEESPDPARTRPIAAPGGYAYKLDRIRGFSLTNVSGWGCAGGSGDVPIMPVIGDPEDSPSRDFRRDAAQPFRHADERARAGHYSVRLADGIGVELAAGLHTGTMRFGFPTGAAGDLLIRGSDSEAGSEWAHTRIDPARNEVVVEVGSGNFCGYLDPVDRRTYYTLHAVIAFDRPIVRHGTWTDGVVTPGSAEARGGTGYGANGFPDPGHGSGAYIGFDGGERTVTARIGLSYVDEAGARANLAAEDGPGTGFDTVRDRAVAAWNKALGQVAVEGGTPQQRVVFATALYHSLLHPNVFSDVDGRYRGLDGAVHRVGSRQRAQYANFSGWDVYRSQLQLVTWLDPRRGSDIAESLLNQAEQDGGTWDRWTHENGATHVMNGDPAAPAVADILAFGGDGFRARAALNSLVRAAEVPTPADGSHAGCEVECVGERPGLAEVLKLHYRPVGAPEWGAAADTLEDATADFALSALAERLGEPAVARRFRQRSGWWRNSFDPRATPDGGYVAPRAADGSWAPVRDDGDAAAHPFIPGTEDGFVEGSAAQYVWDVPFDPAGLFAAMGGTERARARLDGYFFAPNGALAVTEAGNAHAELNNEPSIGAPWLYDWAGEPWKTQELVRAVLDRLWTTAPNGIPGNDDLGEMSSWCVWSMLGL